MTGRRRALVVATDTYDHAALGQLRSAAADAVALSEVLGDPEVGGFEVDVVQNAASHEVQAHIEDLFADSGPDDLVLLHFSGHGLKSDSGELFIAARNTRPDRLASSSVPADFVQRCMRGSRAHSIVLFLDCCYGGAFGEGVAVRAAGPVNVMDAFPKGRLGGGRGRAVISASSAIEYAFEGTTLTAEHEAPPSVFTSAVVHGLRTGDADRDEDGFVSLDELYDYVFDRVREANPKQTPGRDIEMSGEIYVARTRRRRLKAAPLPDALATALRNPDPTYRRGAVLDLRDRLGHPDLAVALGALEALRAVASGDVRAVADDARAAIDAALPSVTPASVDFGRLDADASVDVERTVALGGVPLARQVSVEADPPLSAEVEGDEVVVTFSPTGQSFTGSLVLTAPTGSVTVPVSAGVLDTDASAPPHASEPHSDTAGAMPVPATTAAERATPEPAGTPRRLVPVPEDAAARMDGAVADADSTKPQRAALETPTHDPGHLTERGAQVRVVLGWLAIASGALVAVGGLIAPWDASGARPSDDLVVQVVSFLLLAVAAGVALLSQGSTPAVGVALSYVTASVGALQALGLIGLIRTNMLPETSPGWWLSLVGSSGIVLVALLAIIAPPLRASLVRGHMRWSDPAALVIAAGTAVGVLVFLYLATQASDPFTGYWVAWFTLCSGVTVVLGGMGLTIAPLAAARAWLMATGLTLAERSLALGLLAGHQGQDSPSYTVGIIAGVAVLVGAPLLGRWPHHAADPSTAGPAHTP